MGRALGIDYGLKRIGLALSDPSKFLASTLTTVHAEKKLHATLTKLLKTIEEHDIDQIVIGLPYRMNGTIGLQADEVKHFAEELKKRTDIPIALWDERLTTVQAERVMKEAGLSRKKRTKSIDALSAVIMLQSFLDCANLRP